MSLPAQRGDAGRRELFTCREALEQLLETRVDTFAYPYGCYDDPTRDLAATAFELAVTATPGPVTRGANRAALPRFDANTLTLHDLIAIGG